jgi:hypothetical protein
MVEIFHYLLPLSPIIELFSINIEMRSVFRSFASEIDLEGWEEYPIR